MEIFTKYKQAILRSFGIIMILVGFVSYFWITPKEGYTESDIAAANVARMEASVAGKSGASAKAAKENKSPFLEEFKNTQEKQLEYLTIIVMILGVGFLGYSFIKKD